MTKLAIIQETAEFYISDPSRRAVVGGFFCEYLTEDGRKCAVGRCIANPTRDLTGPIKTLRLEGRLVKLDDVLKDEYKGHTNEFWADLQTFHDAPRNWDKNGITDYGDNHLAILKETYKETTE